MSEFIGFTHSQFTPSLILRPEHKDFLAHEQLAIGAQ